MITREHFLDRLVHECTVCKHLYTKIPADGFDYRPTPEQRSTLELLRYLAACGIGSLRAMIEGTWDAYGAAWEPVKDMSYEEFPAAMDRQIEAIRETFAELTDEQFSTMQVPAVTGGSVSLDYGVLTMTLPWMIAYRMQLFLYARAAGAHNIGTSNNWSGVDRKPKEEHVEETV